MKKLTTALSTALAVAFASPAMADKVLVNDERELDSKGIYTEGDLCVHRLIKLDQIAEGIAKVPGNVVITLDESMRETIENAVRFCEKGTDTYTGLLDQTAPTIQRGNLTLVLPLGPLPK